MSRRQLNFFLTPGRESSIWEGVWIYFEVENLDEHITAIIAKGIKVEELPNDKQWLWRESRLKDPDICQVVWCPIYDYGSEGFRFES